MSESVVNVLKIFLEERFARVDERFDNIKEDFAKVNKRLDAIERELHGAGNGKPGVSIRLDRLESLRKWLAWGDSVANCFAGCFLQSLFFAVREITGADLFGWFRNRRVLARRLFWAVVCCLRGRCAC